MAEERITAQKQNSMANGFSFDDISIRSIIRDVLKRIFLIALCAIVFASGFYIYKCESYVPEYTSKTTFLVSTKDNSYDAYSNLSTTVQLNQVFKMILDSNALQETVKTDLGLKKLDAKIKADIIPETNLLVLSVTSSTPKSSYDILCSVTENYPIFSSEVMGNAVMDVFDAPSVPTHPNNSTGAFRFAIIGFMLGAVLSLAGVIVLSFLKDTVKNESQIEDKLDTSFYCSLPHEHKKKRKGLLISDVTSSFGFEEAYNKLRSNIERDQRKYGYKAITIASAVENEGKTTVAANLAVVLARQEQKVVIVDLDLRQPSVYRIFETDVPLDKDIANYFSKNEESVEGYVIHNKKNNVDMLLSQTGINNINQLLKRRAVNKMVSELKQKYDFIIIDTPPVVYVADVDDITDATDASLIVVREDFAKAMILNDAIDSLTRSQKPLLGAVLNNSLGDSYSSGYGYAYSRYGAYAGYGYGKYGKYGKYSKYGKYGKQHKLSHSKSSREEIANGN